MKRGSFSELITKQRLSSKTPCYRGRACKNINNIAEIPSSKELLFGVFCGFDRSTPILLRYCYWSKLWLWQTSCPHDLVQNRVRLQIHSTSHKLQSKSPRVLHTTFELSRCSSWPNLLLHSLVQSAMIGWRSFVYTISKIELCPRLKDENRPHHCGYAESILQVWQN